MYANWARHDPWFLVRSLFHLQHPNSPLSSIKLVHGAFFCPQFPLSAVREFARWMPAYESMGWPMGMGGSFWGWWRGCAKWLEPRDILLNVSSAREVDGKDSVCVVVGEKDMMLRGTIWDQQVAELRDGLSQLRDGHGAKAAPQEEIEGAEVRSEGGVRLIVVQGAGHHLQNDLQRDVGAEALLRFAKQC